MPRPTQAGFTLIELLVVLSVMALLVALVPWALSAGRDRAVLGAAAARVAGSLRSARLAAMESGRSAAFIADPASGRFGRTGGPLHRLPRGVRLGPGAGLIRFFPDGLASGGAVRLSRGHAWRLLRVDRFTGRVSIRAGSGP